MRPNCVRLGGATVESKRSNGAAIAPERSGGTSGFPRPSPHGEYCGHLVKPLLPPERQKLQSQRDIDDHAHQATRRRLAVTSRDDGPQLGIFLWGAAMIIFWIALAFCFFLSVAQDMSARRYRHRKVSAVACEIGILRNRSVSAPVLWSPRAPSRLVSIGRRLWHVGLTAGPAWPRLSATCSPRSFLPARGWRRYE